MLPMPTGTFRPDLYFNELEKKQMEKKHTLDDRIIESMKIATDKMAVLFNTDDGERIAKTDGDCCSQSWIENIELPVNGFPAKVLSVEDLGFSKEFNTEDDWIKYYAFKITTDKGTILIEYRNSSNGYYGGDLIFDCDTRCYYGGVWGQNQSSLEWTDIKDNQ